MSKPANKMNPASEAETESLFFGGFFVIIIVIVLLICLCSPGKKF